MARKGRPRKGGERHPGGKLKQPKKPTTVEQIAAAERAQAEREMSVVLAQPHRRGSRSQARATALGRFVEDNRLRGELIQAGEHYATIRAKWRAAIEAPRQERIGGSGAEIPAEIVTRWRAQLDDLEHVMLREGVTVMGCVERLAIDGLDLPPGREDYAIRGLMALARELGLIDAKCA
jgi:hypothetical protein